MPGTASADGVPGTRSSAAVLGASVPPVSIEMIGVPTGTVSPSPACSAVTTPAHGDGSSTAAFTVSTSAIVSLTATVSPTATIHFRMSPSVKPSPRSGNKNCWTVIGSELQDPVDGVEDAVEVRQPLVLEPAGRVRGVVAGHPQHRGLERVERLLGDPRGEFGPDAEAARRLVYDDQPAGALHALEHGGRVER